jgi:hypothetical protein
MAIRACRTVSSESRMSPKENARLSRKFEIIIDDAQVVERHINPQEPRNDLAQKVISNEPHGSTDKQNRDGDCTDKFKQKSA